MAGTPILPNGPTEFLTSTDSGVTVSNIATGTNMFYVTNAGTLTGPATKVGIYKTYAAAAAMTLTTGTGVALLPQTSETIVGNFGISPNPGTVYVAYINAASGGSSSLNVTPLAP